MWWPPWLQSLCIRSHWDPTAELRIIPETGPDQAPELVHPGWCLIRTQFKLSGIQPCQLQRQQTGGLNNLSRAVLSRTRQGRKRRDPQKPLAGNPKQTRREDPTKGVFEQRRPPHLVTTQQLWRLKNFSLNRRTIYPANRFLCPLATGKFPAERATPSSQPPLQLLAVVRTTWAPRSDDSPTLRCPLDQERPAESLSQEPSPPLFASQETFVEPRLFHLQELQPWAPDQARSPKHQSEHWASLSRLGSTHLPDHAADLEPRPMAPQKALQSQAVELRCSAQHPHHELAAPKLPSARSSTQPWRAETRTSNANWQGAYSLPPLRSWGQSRRSTMPQLPQSSEHVHQQAEIVAWSGQGLQCEQNAHDTIERSWWAWAQKLSRPPARTRAPQSASSSRRLSHLLSGT